MTDVYSPSAIEMAPATRLATPDSTIVRSLTPPPPTPATSAVLVTRPSIAPNDGGAQPPAGDVAVAVVDLGHGRLGLAHSSPSAPSSIGGSTDDARPVSMRKARYALDPVGRGELAAGAVDVLAAGVAHRRRDAGGPQPGDELPLGR